MIEFSCPSCGHRFNVADQYAGQSGSCKSCGERLRIPINRTSEPIGSEPSSIQLDTRSQVRFREFWGGLPTGRKISAGILILALLCHFLTCSWGSRSYLVGDPILSIIPRIRVNKVYAEEYETSEKRIEEIGELQDEINVKKEESQGDSYSALSDAYLVLLKEEVFLRKGQSHRYRMGFGAFGIWARQGATSAYVFGVLLPAILLISAILLWRNRVIVESCVLA